MQRLFTKKHLSVRSLFVAFTTILGLALILQQFFPIHNASAVTYSKPTVCVYASGGGPLSATVSFTGYSPIVINGCREYSFVSTGKTVTITASANGYYTQSRSFTLNSGSASVIFYLQKVPPPVQYSNVTICTTRSGGGAVNANVTIDGYSTTAMGSDGCHSYTFVRNKTLNITARATGYYTQSKSVYISNANQGIDFVLQPVPPPQPSCYKVSGSVFSDANKDGKKGGGTTEPYLSGAKVTITGGFSTTTNNSGAYSFSCVSKGQRTLSVSKSGYSSFSGSINISSNNIAGLAIPLRPTTTSQNPTTKNTGRITGKVSVQTSNGTRSYIGGNVRVVLSGDKSASTFTNESGSYQFSNLKVPGNYSVKIEPPSSHEAVSKNPVTSINPPTAANSSEVVNFTIKVRSNAGGNDNTIKGVAYIDSNKNKTKDSNEKGLSNVEIKISGTKSDSTRTNSSGSYTFSNLPPGDYTVRPVAPSGYKGTHDWPGTQVGGSTKSVTRNFGFENVSGSNNQTYVIKGKVTRAADGSGMSNVKITLHKRTSSGNAKVGEAVTLKSGGYEFPRTLTPGTYQITANIDGYVTHGVLGIEVVDRDRIVNIAMVRPSSNPNTPQPSIIQVTDTPQPPSNDSGGSDGGTGGNDGGSNGGTNPSPKPSASPTVLERKITGKIWIKKSASSSRQAYTKGDVKVKATNSIGQSKTVAVKSNGTYEISPLTKRTYEVTVTVPKGMKLESSNNVDVLFDPNQTSKSLDFTLIGEMSTQPSPSVSVVQPSPSTTQPSPTVSPTQNEITLSFENILLHGIGNAGDNASPNGKGNANPKRLQRQILVEVTSLTDQTEIIASGRGIVEFDSRTGAYQGDIKLDRSLPPNNYMVRVSLPTYLTKRLANAMTVTTSPKVVITEAISMTTGDINLDDKIDILDYDLLTSCDETIKGNSCSAEHKLRSDLNDDGKVDYFDYNLYLREIATIHGDN